MIRNAGKRILKRFGCEVLLAKDGSEALDVYQSAQANQMKIDVVILDMAMPVMDGMSCFAALKRLDPFVRVVVSSGNLDDSRFDSLISKGALSVLPKPYDVHQLTAVFDKIFKPKPDIAEV